MRFLFSYGLALVIIVIIGVWMASGTLVVPGNGPGNGEVPITEVANADTTALTSDQEALNAAALEKARLAAEAKKAAEAAEAAATEAKNDALTAPESQKHQEELAAEAEAKAKAAEEAKKAADEAVAAAKLAEEEANRIKEELNASKTIAERGAGASNEPPPPQSVRIATYTMQAMPIEVPLRGKTKAKSVVSVVPETQGIVRKVAVTKGQSVNAGDPICTIDPGTRLAAVDQAQAAVDQAQAAFDTNKQLREKGLAPANSGLQLEAALKAAQAAYDNARAEWGRTEVTAPVSGVVQDPIATVGSLAAGGAPCATIVQLDPMLFTGAVPEARIAYAALGLEATIETITKQTAKGKVTYISSIADSATRSFAIEIEVPNPDGKILDGLTASAIVKVGTAPAHLLPQSVLTLDDDGVLGVRAVEDSKVAFYPVTILKDTREGIWVTGLPPKVDIITIGQEFVQAGQVVDAGYGPPDGETTETASVAPEASQS